MALVYRRERCPRYPLDASRIERRFFWALTALFTRATGKSCRSGGCWNPEWYWDDADAFHMSAAKSRSDAEQALDPRHVGLLDDCDAVETTGHLGGLVLEQVAAPR